MLKLKTRKSIIKRYKITGTRLFLRKHAGKTHLLVKKSKSRKRRLSKRICKIKTYKFMISYS
uniref:Large ribosomal subunit protein bL35c n=1 Tax=Astrosyne radiata TaxID=1158023 RepID=A0A2U9NT68_9STRA|nr:ribosomal protein L35 [Astrosyne radiata]YP_009497685.1 ribosomal protein L35 [Astrosyne radiata]AWT40327.1 ribosomal protein L35 [Astrosyne radiata]AWT40398.1 ribosomal protein L35 [Astrosyne radiata]